MDIYGSFMGIFMALLLSRESSNGQNFVTNCQSVSHMTGVSILNISDLALVGITWRLQCWFVNVANKL